VLLITTTGVVIRVPLDQIRALSRATQGVKVMATGDANISSIASFGAGRPSQTEFGIKG
jgi:DNA gyrase/topoisomerase IV subunit A